MKKLLLSLALVLGLSSVASAVDITLPAAGKKWNDYTWTQTGTNFTADVEGYTFLLNKNTSSNDLVSPDQYSIRVYAGANLTITAPDGITFDKVEVTANSLSKATSATASAGWTCSAIVDSKFTVTSTTPQSSLTIDGNGKQLRVESLVITASGGSVPDPVEPTTVEVADIAGFLAANNTTDNLKITGATTAVYQNGRYLWIKDNSGVLLTYNGGDIEMPKFVSGQTVEGGITGKFVNFSQGQLQMANLVAGTFKAGQVGFNVEPEVMQVEEVAADLVNTYVLLKGVKIAAAEAANTYTVTDASGDITLYNQFNNAQYYDVVEVPTGENLNVYAMVAIHSGNLQLMPVKVTTASGREVVATPAFSVAGGAVAEGTEVAITCATEGATIYYTVDGTVPTAASTVYSAPVKVTEAMTIKALAVKVGMDDSSVATASFTIKNDTPVVGNVVTFDFTDPSTLTPAYSEADAVEDGTTGNKKIDLENGVAFTAGAVSLDVNASGNAARLYLQPSKDNAWTFRFYKNSVITIKAGEGNTINKVEFDPQTATYATALGKCTFTGGTYADKVCTANANTSEIVITNPSDGGATIGLNTLIVTLNENAGVSDIEINANAPVEFYNLQGVRMNGDLTPGLYIRRQGNQATKVLVK